MDIRRVGEAALDAVRPVQGVGSQAEQGGTGVRSDLVPQDGSFDHQPNRGVSVGYRAVAVATVMSAYSELLV